MATTWFWLMSFVTAVPASSGLDWSSSTRSLICLPSTPPFALISSKAISTAFLVEMPKVAMPPVSEPYSPTRISLPEPFDPQESVDTATAVKSQHGEKTDPHGGDLLLIPGPKDGVFFRRRRGKVKRSFLSMA